MTAKLKDIDIDQIIKKGKSAPPDIPEDFLIKDVHFLHDHDKMIFILNNGLLLHLPISSFKKLKNASKKKRENFIRPGSGSIVEWPDLNFTLSTEGIITRYLSKTIFYESLQWKIFQHEKNLSERKSFVHSHKLENIIPPIFGKRRRPAHINDLNNVINTFYELYGYSSPPDESQSSIDSIRERLLKMAESIQSEKKEEGSTPL